jgi:hypothetical protein
MLSLSESGSVFLVTVSDSQPLLITIVSPPVPAPELVGQILIMRIGDREFVLHAVATDRNHLAIASAMGPSLEGPVRDPTVAIRRFFRLIGDEGAESVRMSFPSRDAGDAHVDFPTQGGGEAVPLLYECMRPPS